ncbi:hypothetical protein TCE0_033r09212 [Talaromyces pinophilus]|uniref:Uncharacterized protein n=1 Tax=Talaromyces pinophilus TaxID=128442 RepID=A0A6V8HAM4_TALPI|nr:hypothetical protein TCE0_033r09212 [Talaromyces pinophilus]
MIPVTVRKWGEWKTIKFPIKNAADKRPSAVPSEPVVVKEEEARTDEAQAVSQTEIEKLSKKVLSYAVEGLVNQVNVREIKLQDTEKQLREVASANRVLQVGITQRTSEFANLSPENALWKQMSEKWQDQEIPDDDCVLKKDYIERHKRVNAMVIEDYVLMHVEIDRLGGEYQNNETQQRNNALEAQRRADVDLILAILDAHQLRENILAYQYNALLRQYDITRNDNEQLVQALVNTVNRHEDELAIVLCQMAEIAHIPGANGTNPRRSQPRSRPELRLVQHGSQRYSESLTPGGRWQQTIASRLLNDALLLA